MLAPQWQGKVLFGAFSPESVTVRLQMMTEYDFLILYFFFNSVLNITKITLAIVLG